MGGKQSSEAGAAEPKVDLAEILKENTYYPEKAAKYPYFLVQLSETEELEYKGALVSDAIVEYIKAHDVTHIIAQTHGWNTPPDKAVAVPFTEFMGGMQNDAAMPDGDHFRPIFVAFIWPALPLEFVRADDALTRTELLAAAEKEATGEETDIAKAAFAAKKAIEDDNPDDEDLANQLEILADDSRNDSDSEDDEDFEAKVRRLKEEAVVQKAGFFGAMSNVAKTILNPFQHFAFGRLMARGQRTGKVMEKVLGKLMVANGDVKTKVCLMANSLGAHVLASILNKPQTLPHKIHTVFFVQGAITREVFADTKKFCAITNNVAGPIICTHSERDLMLKNVFGMFFGSAIGLSGVERGHSILMKGLRQAGEEPYRFACGEWTSVNGTQYVLRIFEASFVGG